MVVEFACGTAPLAVAGIFEGRHVISLDMDPKVTAAAKARLAEEKVFMHDCLVANVSGITRGSLADTIPSRGLLQAPSDIWSVGRGILKQLKW